MNQKPRPQLMPLFPTKQLRDRSGLRTMCPDETVERVLLTTEKILSAFQTEKSDG